MVECAVRPDGIRISKRGRSELLIQAPDWSNRPHTPSGAERAKESICGVTSRLRIPQAVLSITNRSDYAHSEWTVENEGLTLPAAEYRLGVQSELDVYVAFEGVATIESDADREHVVVTFPERTRVTIGCNERTAFPTESITVRPTAAGLATALSHLHAGMKTDGPDRSIPTLRDHPPTLEFGEDERVPTDVRVATSRTGILLDLPNDFATVLVCAPLAYYLQATVTVGDRTEPRLYAPSVDVDVPLPRLPDLQEAVTELVQNVFYMDCLVRTAGPHGMPLVESRALDELGLDPETTYHAEPCERLRTYLELPTATVRKHVPDWHLTTYVTPDDVHARSLPFVLDRLSLVALPATSALEGRELIERSLDEFYRADSFASVPVVKPELQHGRIHAWLADGIPIDVFKTTHSAFQNRLRYTDRTDGPTRITVVLNDRSMESEHTDVARIYREGSKGLPSDVEVHEQLTCEELATIFERETEFVHYIGHCEVDGLKCADGLLAASSLERCNAQTFFLNACGSYHQGMDMVERGSVAGAVTFSPVLDRQAATVGTTFARLLVHGFSFERAIGLARRRIMMGKDYAVVGDGTHRLSRRKSAHPITMFVDKRDVDRFALSLDTVRAWTAGGVYHPTVEPNDGPCLDGSRPTYEVSRTELYRILSETADPVIFEGRFFWPEELRTQL